MYIANSLIQDKQKDILNYFSKDIRKYLYNIDLKDAYEIHMGIDMPLCIYFLDGRYCVSKKGMLTRNISGAVRVTKDDIEKCLELITGASMYSVKDEISNGYITVSGGHRVGVVGSAIVRKGEVSFIKDISALNFRLAGESVGAADKVMPYILKDDTILNTLIVSPPGAGKTTILRDIARQLSEVGKRVSIVDERYEIAAMHEGKSNFNLGVSCDVLAGVKKSQGMVMMLRSMSPEVIITDELGTSEDIQAIKKMLNCGVSVIASIHGSNINFDEYKYNKISKYFNVIVTLSKRNGAGTIERIDVH